MEKLAIIKKKTNSNYLILYSDQHPDYFQDQLKVLEELNSVNYLETRCPNLGVLKSHLSYFLKNFSQDNGWFNLSPQESINLLKVVESINNDLISDSQEEASKFSQNSAKNVELDHIGSTKVAEFVKVIQSTNSSSHLDNLDSGGYLLLYEKEWKPTIIKKVYILFRK